MNVRAARPTRWALSVAGKFFERRHDPLVLGRMAGTGADVSEAELVQELAYRALVIDHVEALSDKLLQVDPAPAHDAVHGSIRSGLNDVGQFGLLLSGEAGRVALGPAVRQPVRTALVEAVGPVAQGLTMHAADA